MQYFEVAVDHRSIKSTSTLTYSYSDDIPVGSVVRVPIRTSQSNGVLLENVKKPKYKTRDISQIIYPAALPKQLIELTHWMSSYYSVELAAVMQTVLPRGLHKKRRATDSKNQPKHATRSKLATKLTDDQISSLKTLGKNKTKTVLLHGATGSGKTRIYIEQAKTMRDVGKSSIILVPEIGLTSQMVADFKQVFPDVFVIHSNQSEAFRHKQWQAILESPAPVVIGPRSALFSPISKLGLIVVDEAHETSYKQDLSPKYHALRVASKLSQLHQAQLILGTATPRVEDYYLAEHTKSPIITIEKPVRPLLRQDIVAVDLRDKDNFKQGSRILSDELLKSIDKSLKNQEQVLLFHNRRGTSTQVVCMHCGWVAECPNCLLPVTHHGDWHQLICHVCNFRQDVLTSCPKCGKAELMYKGIGTKQIEREVRSLYKSANIARFDSDVSKANQLERRYDELYKGEIDIIVGTQMIAKGLDLPQLSTVGVVLADTSLYLPDFSANERAFQLLYQVIGRAGRHKHGRVIIQSYTPDHPAIEAAINRDYTTFYDHEISERDLTLYPPFAFLLKLTVVRKSKDSTQKAADEFAQKLKKINGIKVLGPSPAFHEKTKTGWRWQIVVKSKKRANLQEITKQIPSNWQFELDPINLL